MGRLAKRGEQREPLGLMCGWKEQLVRRGEQREIEKDGCSRQLSR